MIVSNIKFDSPIFCLLEGAFKIHLAQNLRGHVPPSFNGHVASACDCPIDCQTINTVNTLKNKGASKGSSSDAIEEPFLVPQRTIQSKVL